MARIKKPKFKRVLLKLSGESLAGKRETGIDPQVLSYFAQEIKKAHQHGVQIAVVIGGGNIFRGLSETAKDLDRVTADNMGMLATVINSLALQDTLNRQGIKSRALSAVEMPKFSELYVRDKALENLKNDEVVILSAGTGNPYFTTDTAAVLRAVELQADAVLKGTRVDGVFNADPEKVDTAFKFDALTYMQVLEKNLKVMDITAITMAMDNRLPVIVFNFDKKDNFEKVILGEAVGTIIQG